MSVKDFLLNRESKNIDVNSNIKKENLHYILTGIMASFGCHKISKHFFSQQTGLLESI